VSTAQCHNRIQRTVAGCRKPWLPQRPAPPLLRRRDRVTRGSRYPTRRNGLAPRRWSDNSTSGRSPTPCSDPSFLDVARINREGHLPTMGGYWETVPLRAVVASPSVLHPRRTPCSHVRRTHDVGCRRPKGHHTANAKGCVTCGLSESVQAELSTVRANSMVAVTTTITRERAGQEPGQARCTARMNRRAHRRQTHP
jgi:hypothetical protein